MIERKKQAEKLSPDQKKSLTVLVISVVVFLYFAVMILLSKLEYNTVFTAAISEMLTIPGLLLLVFSIVVSLVSFVRNRFRIHQLSFYSLLIQLVTVGLLVFIAG